METLTLEMSRVSADHGKARGRRPDRDRVFFIILSASALVTPVLLVAFVLVLADGAWLSIKTFGFSFLTSSVWEPNPDREQYGALPFIVGTLVSSILALALAGPAGIAIATFINEVLAERLRGSARFLIEVLATIPSVVYGLWGVFVLAPFVTGSVAPTLTQVLGWLPLFASPSEPRNMLCAVLILSIMILPIIVSVSLDAIRAVPVTLREAALGLGATRWEMVRMAVWPAATAVTSPDASTVATSGLLLVHATVGLGTTAPAPSRTSTAIVCVAPAPASITPVGDTVTALATTLTVTVTVSARPPGAVAMMSALPSETAVTSPDAVTAATDGAVLIHANATPPTAAPSPSRAVAVSCCWFPCGVTFQLPSVTCTVAPRIPRRTVPVWLTAVISDAEVPQISITVLGVPLVIAVQVDPSQRLMAPLEPTTKMFDDVVPHSPYPETPAGSALHDAPS